MVRHYHFSRRAQPRLLPPGSVSTGNAVVAQDGLPPLQLQAPDRAPPRHPQPTTLYSFRRSPFETSQTLHGGCGGPAPGRRRRPSSARREHEAASDPRNWIACWERCSCWHAPSSTRVPCGLSGATAARWTLRGGCWVHGAVVVDAYACMAAWRWGPGCSLAGWLRARGCGVTRLFTLVLCRAHRGPPLPPQLGAPGSPEGPSSASSRCCLCLPACPPACPLACTCGSPSPFFSFLPPPLRHLHRWPPCPLHMLLLWVQVSISVKSRYSCTPLSPAPTPVCVCH